MKKKWLYFGIFSAISLMPITSIASEKINSVSVKIEAEEEDTMDMPDLEITTSASKYTVDGYDVTIGLDGYSTYEEEEDDGPGPGGNTEEERDFSNEPVTIEITLTAEEDYTFGVMAKDDIRVRGFDANCIKASRQNSGETLVLTVELPGIKERIGFVESPEWKDNTIASWTPAENALTYEVRLYRDDKNVGTTYETKGTSYNFAPLMLKEGNYHYTIRARGLEDEKGIKTESEPIYISKEIAESLKDKYQLKYEELPEGSGPSTPRVLLNGGWQLEDGKYWYRRDDGTFPQNEWLKLGNDWYFFDEDGHLVSNDKITWKGETYSFRKDGRMID